jgi:hypothetical protein
MAEAIESLNTPRFSARLDSWLYRILREIDFTSSAARGFSVRIEDMLTNPLVFPRALGPGSVQAKLSREALVPDRATLPPPSGQPTAIAPATRQNSIAGPL